jgi:hypothetical protein
MPWIAKGDATSLSVFHVSLLDELGSKPLQSQMMSHPSKLVQESLRICAV